MSVIVSLKQMPAQVLMDISQSNCASEYLAKLELYSLAPEIENLDQWESELKDKLNFNQAITILKTLELDIVTTIESIQSLLKSAQFPSIDFDREYGDIQIFLTGEPYSPDNYIVAEKSIDNISFPLVNAFGGRQFEFDMDSDFYLTEADAKGVLSEFFAFTYNNAFIPETDVKIISNSLTLISEDFSYHWKIRWEHLNLDMAAFDEVDDVEFYEMFYDLLVFYQDSARQGSAVCINIG